MTEGPWGFYEFFAGGGLARLGLGRRWTCLLARDLRQEGIGIMRVFWRWGTQSQRCGEA